jgi:signal transduction histidine kinase
MIREGQDSSVRAPDFRALFEAVPGRYLVLRPDPPRFTILVATGAYRQAAGLARGDIVGRGLFECLSDASPGHPGPAGAASLRDSLETVLRTRAPQAMPVQRWDTQRADGKGEERYWRPVNTPVAGPSGEVAYIVHELEDVTEQRRAEGRARLLTAASDVLDASLDLEATLATLTRLVVPDVADWCAVDVLDADERTVRRAAVAHAEAARLPDGHALPERSPTAADAPFATAVVLRTREPELVSDVPDDPDAASAIGGGERFAFARSLGLRSYLCVPLEARGHCLGALCLGQLQSGRRFVEADLAFAVELGRRAGLALDNARLFTAAREARGRAERLQSVTAELAQALRPADVMEVVLGAQLDAAGAAAGVVTLLSADGATLETVHATGYPADLTTPWHHLPVDAPLPLTEAVRTGAPVFVGSQSDWAERYPAAAADSVASGYHAAAAVPLVAEGRIFGAIGLSFREPRVFTLEERALIAALAQQCAQALERARLYEAERMARGEAEAARAEAEVANRAKSEFLATMSHEIRTPINAIQGYTQLLELGLAGPISSQQHEHLQRLRASSQHLLGIVNDVLDLAKVDSGQMSVARDRATTSRAVQSALALILPQAEGKGVRLVEVRLGDPGEPYLGDEDRVRQVLVNLLSNAVKFTLPGGTVAIDSGTVDEAPPQARLHGSGPWVFLRVEDSGIGIPPEQQARIFEAFHQVEGGRTRTAGGTGLGLTISRRLARLMGGDLTVDSAVGRGSVFTLWLPATSQITGEWRQIQDSKDGTAGAGRRAMEETWVHGLAEIGAHLRERLDDVLEAYTARLRADPAFPQAVPLRRSELEDHQLPFLSDLAQMLLVIEETGGLESDVLRDGSTIQRVVAELHGRQRQRRGWTDAQLEREYAILGEELEYLVQRVIREGDGPGDATTALEVLHRLMGRAADTARRALRYATQHAPA